MSKSSLPPIGQLLQLYKGVDEPEAMKAWRQQEGLSKKYARLMAQFIFELYRNVDEIRKIRRSASNVTRRAILSDYASGLEASSDAGDWRVRFVRHLESHYRW